MSRVAAPERGSVWLSGIAKPGTFVLHARVLL